MIDDLYICCVIIIFLVENICCYLIFRLKLFANNELKISCLVSLLSEQDIGKKDKNVEFLTSHMLLS